METGALWGLCHPTLVWSLTERWKSFLPLGWDYLCNFFPQCRGCEEEEKGPRLRQREGKLGEQRWQLPDHRNQFSPQLSWASPWPVPRTEETVGPATQASSFRPSQIGINSPPLYPPLPQPHLRLALSFCCRSERERKIALDIAFLVHFQ